MFRSFQSIRGTGTAENIANATPIVSSTTKFVSSFDPSGQTADHAADMIRPRRDGVVHPRQRQQVSRRVPRVIRAAAKHLVGYDDQMRALPVQALHAAHRRLYRIPPRAVRIVQLVGDQIAHVLQQRRPPRGQNQPVKPNRTFQRVKSLFPAHVPVARHAPFALRIPDAHGRHIKARQAALHSQTLRKRALSAGRAADHQRQHCGVYGAMPPSANE